MPTARLWLWHITLQEEVWRKVGKPRRTRCRVHIHIAEKPNNRPASGQTIALQRSLSVLCPLGSHLIDDRMIATLDHLWSDLGQGQGQPIGQMTSYQGTIVVGGRLPE